MKQDYKLKNALAILLYLFSDSVVTAQQQLTSNQNYWFLANENIAAVSEDAKLNIQSLYRRNWLRFSHSPELLFCRIEASNASHAWDMKVQQYSNSFYRQQDIKVGWRYFLKLDDNQKLFFGVRFGLLRNTYSWANLNAQHPEEISELFRQNNWTSPVSDFGLLYSFKDYRLAFSGTNFNLRANETLTFGIRELPTFALLTSYKFNFSKLSLSPILQLRSMLGLPITSDFSILLEKEKVVGVQIGYKNKSSIYTNLRFFVGPQLAFSFSYDYPLTTQAITGYGSELALILITN